MGAFYANITLTGAELGPVVEALRGRNAAVFPLQDGQLVVADSVCDLQDVDAIGALAARLSNDFSCKSLSALVHDDDVLLFLCHHRGELLAWYHSAPDYFDFGRRGKPRGPEVNNLDSLCDLYDVGEPHKLARLLNKADFAFESDRHRKIVQAMGLPPITVGLRLDTIEDDLRCAELPTIDLEWAPDPPPEEDKQLVQDRRFFERLGPDDPERSCRSEGCDNAAIANSVMCRAHHYEMVRGRKCPF